MNSKIFVVVYFILWVLCFVSIAPNCRANASNTFLYILMDADIPQAASPDGIGNSPSAIAFRSTAHGFSRIRDLDLSPEDVLQKLIVTPDGRFLFEECQTSEIDPSSPTYYIEYRILPDGNVRQLRRIGPSETKGGTNLAFGSTRTAYMTTPNAAGSARVLSFRFTPNGRFVLFGTTPACGSTYSPLIVSRSGTSAYLPDLENRLWQYSVASDGRLNPKMPLFVTCGFDDQFVVLPNEQAAYAIQYSPGRVYQYNSHHGLLDSVVPSKFSFGHYLCGITASADSHYVYVVGDNTLASFHVTTNGALKPTSFHLLGKFVSPITLDTRTKILYALDYNRNNLRAFTSGTGGNLQAIKGRETKLFGQAIKIIVVHR